MGTGGETFRLDTPLAQRRINRFKHFKKYVTKRPCNYRIRYEGTNFLLERFNRSLFFPRWEMISESGEWEDVGPSS